MSGPESRVPDPERVLDRRVLGDLRLLGDWDRDFVLLDRRPNWDLA